MQVPQSLKLQIDAIMGNMRSGPFQTFLEAELQTTLRNLADAADDRLLRQLQGRARLLREFLDYIAVAR